MSSWWLGIYRRFKENGWTLAVAVNPLNKGIQEDQSDIVAAVLINLIIS